ncbi:type VI secretion system ATPase TssH chaperone [Desulfuromonas soudanensis]|uniref:Type VI secretion system ATPase TssH chaperone n=1 Tax=Desulfuromonas soudanensis TaxID=1603606 RepID=A0A0M4DKV7_9BACT|nr:type VI secretion system ATPase TssH [Desulfuromonas soudanensis]ALC17970.1 type VI secretion system ATPase TssH chaperone [Desulfuromonas soudanensis]
MDSRHLRALLDRLNPHCARALEAGAAFAATRGHYEVTIEHVAVKLLEDGGGDFDRILQYFAVDLDSFWQDLLENLSRLRQGNQGKPIFSQNLYQWLERGWLTASLHYAGTELRSAALLEALVEMIPQLPGKGFDRLEALPLPQLRRQYSAMAAGSAESAAEGAEAPRPEVLPSISSPEGSSALARFTIDVTGRAACGEIDPVLGRHDEVRQAIDILTRRRKNNPILVGEPGVGKTAIVEGMALRIVEGKVPALLCGVRLLTLDLGLLQAGAGVKGEFEKRLKNVIDEVKTSTTPIILFIDEAHTLVGAGGEAGQGDAANLLKPALARGELRTIAATTWAEYRKYFERDAALARRFQLVKVDEPGLEQAIGMLSGLKTLYQSHHGVLITDDALEAAVRLSSRYISGRQLPDKAIDLIDTAAARVRMGQAAIPALIDAGREHIAYLQRRLGHLEEDRRQGVNADSRLIATLQREEAESRERLEGHERQWEEERALVGEIGRERPTEDGDGDFSAAGCRARRRLREVQGDAPLVQAEVDAEAIAAVVADWTGIPVGKMVRDDIASLIELEGALATRIVGQEGALAEIGRAVRSARAKLRNPETPQGVFLLAGPSGVGKTETARVIAEQLFGGERFLITINMSEYQEAHTVSQLKGAPPGYVGYGEGGVLTEAVRQRPYAVLLLDEVEKAHPEVMNLFYQVFDRGFMRDGEGREIDFKNTVILMTTNLGAAEISERTVPPEAADTPWERPSLSALAEAIRPALLSALAPALLARMQVVPYLPLEAEALHSIAALKLEALAKRLRQAHDIELRCRPQVVAYLAGRCRQGASGARMVNALIEQQLVPGIAKSLLQFMAAGEMPEILSLEIDDKGDLSCLFADRCADGEEDRAPGDEEHEDDLAKAAQG